MFYSAFYSILELVTLGFDVRPTDVFLLTMSISSSIRQTGRVLLSHSDTDSQRSYSHQCANKSCPALLLYASSDVITTAYLKFSTDCIRSYAAYLENLKDSDVPAGDSLALCALHVHCTCIVYRQGRPVRALCDS